ncbi:DUF1345 domain-containing protein [Rhizobium sp. KVB221]|uniref:DUF1345 domain-containing protein n=1 Tax=Rhizobium setariae TaxID=2801340 RepID=A0A936YW00_9HYPH|nr:DUF1345 domain-containing protein [Rhizobium setariae]MBL0374622.1 DUF1345 domain-containing protein [Rhizobium setariae]
MDMAVLRHVRARPRLVLCTLAGIGLFMFYPFDGDASARLLLSWDISAGAFLILTTFMMVGATDEQMRTRAERADEGRFAVLALSVVAAAASLVAIIAELAKTKAEHSGDPGFYIAVSIATIVISWAFIQVIFTEHYAHEYYMEHKGGKRVRNARGGGLDFFDEKSPDYIDFLYFTVTIGVANQTADINIRSRSMRILVLIQSVISFFFNTTILALSINIATSIV